MTRVKVCKCEHKYQDKKYGKGKRVHNSVSDSNNTGNWRCTVCGAMST